MNPLATRGLFFPKKLSGVSCEQGLFKMSYPLGFQVRRRRGRRRYARRVRSVGVPADDLHYLNSRLVLAHV